MNRYQIFRYQHKGLQTLLCHTGLLLHRTDFSSEDEEKIAIGRLRLLLRLLAKYRQCTDVYLLPAVMAYEPGIADWFAQESQKGNPLTQTLEHLLAVCKSHLPPPEKEKVGNEIMAAFQAYSLFVQQLLAKEVKVLLVVLQRYHSDRELQIMAWQVIAGTGPSVMFVFLKSIIRGLSLPEMLPWMEEVKTVAPADEFQLLLKAAEGVLPANRWTVLHYRLGAAAPAA